MVKPVCPKCDNRKTWKNVRMVGRKNKVTCARCDTVVEVDGGIEIDNVEGDMTFGFSS